MPKTRLQLLFSTGRDGQVDEDLGKFPEQTADTDADIDQTLNSLFENLQEQATMKGQEEDNSAPPNATQELDMLQEMMQQLGTSDDAEGGADALILTGSGTGAETPLEDVKLVREACPEARILVGSGVGVETIGEVLGLADGAIVGTALKEGGVVSRPVDPSRVEALVEAAGA